MIVALLLAAGLLALERSENTYLRLVRGRIRPGAVLGAKVLLAGGAAAADAQYKAEYRHKKETQAEPYARDAALSGANPAAAVLVRDR